MPVVTDPNLSTSDFERLSRVIYDHCGITLKAEKMELVRARLAKRLRATGVSTYQQYIDTVLSNHDSEEFVKLIDAISTNLTSFFRESQHFDFLAQTHLPKVVRTNSGTRRLRGWSAGCSSGEEPYTIAMVLNETLPSLGASGWDVKLLATDISTQVLDRARTGIYDEERARTIPAAFRGKYFEPRKKDGETYIAAKPELRNLIVFNRLNLMEAWPFTGPFDFIFCRNVMIYFDKPTQERLVQRYYDMLAPGGVLFTGHSESLTGISHKFAFVQPTIYRK